MKCNGGTEIAEGSERIPHHRSWHDVAADDNSIYVFLSELVEDSFECGQIAVDVVEGGGPHTTS
jgi:hypothetical protein